MRRPLRPRRRHQNDSRLIVGGLLVVGGMFILLKTLPPWALWGTVALLCIACGLLLVFSAAY